MASLGLYVFRIIEDAGNTSLPTPYFDQQDAIKAALDLKEKAKNKLDYRVVKTIPVYSTKETSSATQDENSFF